jgi:outer membrane protein assembly factor BamB
MKKSLLLGALSAALCAQNVTTVQYNNARTGWNQEEYVLNVSNVNPTTFGKIWTAQLDGMIYSSPLYVKGVVIGDEPRDVVYVATENNRVYALDANNNGAQLWSYFLGPPGLRLGDLGCGTIMPNIGITSTPVIDLVTGTLYAVGLVRDVVPPVFKMAAIDISTGQPKDGWPVIIDPPAEIPLETRMTENRGALLLGKNGKVYVPFGGYSGDCLFYRGWVVAVDIADPRAQLSYRTPSDPAHHGGGIWASGGVAADDQDFIYPSTGNSDGRPVGLDYSNAVLRLGPDLTFSEDPADFFMPSNWVVLNLLDIDLGSSTPMLLPPQKASSTPNMIFITGKRGIGHLIDRDYPGGVATGDGTIGEGVFSKKVFGSAFSTAAYYEDPVNGPTIFLAGRGAQPDCGTRSGVVALSLRVDGDRNSYYETAWCTRSMDTAMSPVVTSAPGEPGILWVVDRGPVGQSSGVLYAYNASASEQPEELYNSNQVPEDALGETQTHNFLHFTAVDGKVFVGNCSPCTGSNQTNSVVAYGLRQP